MTAAATPVALALIALALGILVWRRNPSGLTEARRFTVIQLSALALRLPFAILFAMFLGELVPATAVTGLIGQNSGLWGILVASMIGGMLPGGPMISFPLAIVFWQAGAGPAQTVALLTGWSVFAIHRLIAFELPMMGWRFSVIRLLSSAALPVCAGLTTAAVLSATGLTIRP